MILTLTMNPAVDIGYTVETLKMDTVNRTQKVSKTPGGKGLNVSRVLKQLGSPVLATGLLGGHIGAFIKEKLDEVALENNFYPIQSETRNLRGRSYHYTRRTSRFPRPLRNLIKRSRSYHDFW